MRRGAKALSDQDAREVCDLYAWGAELWIICAFYNVHKTTVREYVRRAGGELRPGYRPIGSKSSRPRTPAVATARNARAGGVDQLLRARAHELIDTRTGQHRAGANTRSCQEEAFENRYAFLRNGSRLQDLE